MKILILICLSLFFTSGAWAWGGRGHHTICEAASFLVKNKTLKETLQQKPFMMGHLCNIPDIYWRNLGPEVGKQGNSAHFIDVEVLGIPLKDIPTDYKKIVSKYTGAKNAFKEGSVLFSIPLEFGSIWWRADQFYRRAIGLGSDWKKAVPPANFKEEQDENLPFNKATYEFFVNLGLLGHFVGDNGQPLHGTSDYDGYGAGHGGIHSFFEEAVVSAQGYDLTVKVIEEALVLQKLMDSKKKEDLKWVQFLKEKSVVEKMKALTLLSAEEIPSIYALDPIQAPSAMREEKGMAIKTPAGRQSADTVAAKFQPLIVRDMARSAALLAQLWDMAYEKVGEPKLALYKSFKFPFTPDFVPPDYFDLKTLEKKESK